MPTRAHRVKTTRSGHPAYIIEISSPGTPKRFKVREIVSKRFGNPHGASSDSLGRNPPDIWNLRQSNTNLNQIKYKFKYNPTYSLYCTDLRLTILVMSGMRLLRCCCYTLTPPARSVFTPTGLIILAPE